MQAQTVLILHGATSNLRDPYEALKGHLDDFHVIYLDRPGLGRSERPEGAWTPAREADLIQAFLEQKHLNQVILVGHSWGGAIATRTALDHSERIKGLLLLAPALRAWVGEAAWYNKASRWPGLGFLITDIAIPLIGPSQMRAGVDEAADDRHGSD